MTDLGALRRNPPRLPAGAFRSPVRIRFSHTDPAGIVYFANYFDMFNSVVEDWVDQALGLDYADLILTHRCGLPVVHAECDFLQPSRMGETVSLGVVVNRVGGSSIDIRIIGEHGGDHDDDQGGGRGTGQETGAGTRLVGRLVLVAMNLDTHRAIPVPDALRSAIDSYRTACHG
jgi:4-hydroxybenzoyl-CoA thioesterase